MLNNRIQQMGIHRRCRRCGRLRVRVCVLLRRLRRVRLRLPGGGVWDGWAIILFKHKRTRDLRVFFIFLVICRRLCI